MIPTIEEISATIAIGSLWCLFVRPYPTNHPCPPDLLVTRELVPSFNVESVTRNSVQSVFSYSLISFKIYAAAIFLLSYFTFITHSTGACMNHRISIFILYITFGCLITHSFFDLIQSNLHQHFSCRPHALHHYLQHPHVSYSLAWPDLFFSAGIIACDFCNILDNALAHVKGLKI